MKRFPAQMLFVFFFFNEDLLKLGKIKEGENLQGSMNINIVSQTETGNGTKKINIFQVMK